MTDIKKRHFCKSVALLSLIPLLKIDFLSANTNVQNSVLSGSVIVNGKKVSKNSDLDFNQIIVQLEQQQWIVTVPVIPKQIMKLMIANI
jgi:hypothetical protein